MKTIFLAPVENCLLIFLMIAICATGCGQSTTAERALASVNKSNIQRLGNLYNKYQSEHKWIGPANEAEFKKYVLDSPPARLKMIGIDANKVESLFISERDGQPFVFRYKVPGSAMGKIDPVVFEQAGVNGKRLVGFTNKPPIEVATESEYQDLLAGNFTPDNNSRGGEPIRNTGQ